jgi:acetoin utilization protein AcuB
MIKQKSNIESEMTSYPAVVGPKTPVLEAAELMKGLGIRHLPVLDSGRVLGVISDRDLRQAMLLSDSMSLVVTDVMISEVYCVSLGTPIWVVAKKMASNKWGCAVVINKQGAVVGIFTTTDAMRLLADLLAPEGESDFLSLDRESAHPRYLTVERVLSGDCW